ncbi:MAG: tyrosine-type recombinase/integrase [Ignavibacteriae bacterium]|nr:tyrosine-type recombinase/integrase [Ignavibacteriota bacterium]
MNLAKRKNGIYYIQYFDSEDNKTRRVSTSKRNKSDALLFLAEFDNYLKSKTQLKHSTLNSFKDEYIRYIGRTHSVKYLSSIELSFRQLLKSIRDIPLLEIKVIHVQEFLSETYQRTEKGAELYLRTLKASFNRAIDWGYIKENPFKKVKLPKSQKSFPVFISETELNQIVTNTKSKDLRSLFILAFFTGMRLGELVNLKWSEIKLQSRMITIKNDKSFSTKSKKDRTIPMNKKIIVILKKKMKEGIKSEFVFSKTEGIKFNNDYVSKSFKKAVRKAKMDEKIHFHTLRHSFASRLVQKGASIYIVKELLGHSDVTTTQIYSHLQPNNFIAVIDLL